jgi:DNA-binding NarL/FixJ family response regulator
MNNGAENLARVLFFDDDPQHLKLYLWIIERGPFSVIPVLVSGKPLEIPENAPDVVALDYRLKGPSSAVDIAKRLKSAYPSTPILVLSELEWLPEDIAEYSAAFVKKGEPENLLNTLMQLTQAAVRSAPSNSR